MSSCFAAGDVISTMENGPKIHEFTLTIISGYHNYVGFVQLNRTASFFVWGQHSRASRHKKISDSLSDRPRTIRANLVMTCKSVGASLLGLTHYT